MYLDLTAEEVEEVLGGLQCVIDNLCGSRKECAEVQLVIDVVTRQLDEQAETVVRGFGG